MRAVCATFYTMPNHRAKPLTERQAIFCKAYVKIGRPKLAAISAGTSPGSAPVRANRWLKLPQVQQRIRTLKQTVARKHSNEVRKALKELLRTNLAIIQRSIETGRNMPRYKRAMNTLKTMGLLNLQGFTPDSTGSTRRSCPWCGQPAGPRPQDVVRDTKDNRAFKLSDV